MKPPRINTHGFHISRPEVCSTAFATSTDPANRAALEQALAEADAVAAQVALELHFDGVFGPEYAEQTTSYLVEARFGDRVETAQATSREQIGKRWSARSYPDVGGFARGLCLPGCDREMFDGRQFSDWIDDALLKRSTKLPYFRVRCAGRRAIRETEKAQRTAEREARQRSV